MRFGPLLLLLAAALLAAAPALAQAQAQGDLDDEPLVVVPPPLADLDPAGVRGRIGQPDLSRMEGAGGLWTYRLPGCALFVHFADAGRGLRVIGASSGPRRHGDPAPDTNACVAEALKRPPMVAAAPVASAQPKAAQPSVAQP